MIQVIITWIGIVVRFFCLIEIIGYGEIIWYENTQ